MRVRPQPIAQRLILFSLAASLAIGLVVWAVGWRPFGPQTGRGGRCAAATELSRTVLVSHLTFYPAWSLGRRATCYHTFTIGTSVRGRPITAYQFGHGPQSLVYIGGIHGNEVNATKLMEQWRDALHASSRRIPAGRSIVVIPAANPDGLAQHSRLNARQVDLNRNFPARDWKQTVTLPDNASPADAGGPEPLSEPESRAIAEYLERTRPQLVVSFHSMAAVIEPNEAGNSTAIATAYAQKSGYEQVSAADSQAIFQYDTTGALEDWLRDGPGFPAILVELASNQDSEFNRNQAALWETVDQEKRTAEEEQ